MSSPVRAVLKAFSEKKASMDQVMRALAEHQDWYVPAHAIKGTVAQNAVIYAQEFSMPKSPLMLFTDRQAADVAVEQLGHKAMGIYFGGVTGDDILSRLADFTDAQAMQVNLGSPTSQQWFVARGGFQLCALWAGVPPFEKSVATMADGVFEKVLAYTGWMTLVAKSDKTFVRYPVNGVEHAFAFTAPDLADQMIKTLPADQQPQVMTAVLTGRPLFEVLAKAKYGLLINPNTAKQSVFPPQLVQSLGSG